MLFIRKEAITIVVLLTTVPMVLVFALNLIAAAYMIQYYDFFNQKKCHPILSLGLSIILYITTLAIAFYLTGVSMTHFPENLHENIVNLSLFVMILAIQSFPILLLSVLIKKKQ